MLNKRSIKAKITLITTAVLLVLIFVLTIAQNYVTMLVYKNAIIDTSDEIPSVSIIDYNNGDIEYYSGTIVIDVVQTSAYMANLLLALVIAIIGIILIRLALSHYLKPVEKLTEEIEKIDEDNMNVQLDIPASKDEISRLTVAFNKMMSKISTTYKYQKEFSQNVAHELKTPVTAMTTTLDVLQLDDVPSEEDYRNAVANISNSVQRMKAIIDALLNINRQASDKSLEQLAMNEICTLIVSEFDTEIKEKDLHIRIVGDKQFVANRITWSLIVRNIISNSIRYNRTGGSIECEIDDNYLRISDTGIGIPEEKLSRIFEPFYCVDSSRSRELGGSGLGLYIVKQLVELENATIEVMPNVPEGTFIEIKFC